MFNVVIKRNIFYLIFIEIFFSGCSSDKQMKDGLPFIDIRKNYPEKEIILDEIADITYIHLNTENDDYLYRGGILDVTENTIVVNDATSGSILFFSKDGNPKSRFNRKGQSGEDYIDVRIVQYDEAADDVFVLPSVTHNKLQVYSSTGKYKRTIVLPQGTFVNPYVSFDDESLFVYDSSIERRKLFPDDENLTIEYFSSPFVLISKTDGRVLDYVELSSKNIRLSDMSVDSEMGGLSVIKSYLIKCKEGVLICNPETDTVFLYNKNRLLIPVICKTPLVSALDPMVYMNNCVDVGRYQFMEIFTVRWDYTAFSFPAKYFMRDKETGEIFRQKIVLSDYKGKEFIISPLKSGRNYETGPWFILDLIELKDAYKENRLSGKLKELVETLNEMEDNDVFMFVNFK